MDSEFQDILKNKNTFRNTNSAMENIRENPIGRLMKLNVHKTHITDKILKSSKLQTSSFETALVLKCIRKWKFVKYTRTCIFSQMKKNFYYSPIHDQTNHLIFTPTC